ncbi:MAG: ABC transporter permease [Promethearchaeota archaeon]
MSLKILFFDELKGFYKSKVMIILWIGMPLVTIIMHFFQSDTGGFPFSTLVAIVTASIGGTLGSAMLGTSMANEMSSHVYELFLIRPVKRYNLILAKFFAVYLCLFIATIISLIAGLIIDYFTIGIPSQSFADITIQSLITTMAAMAISCSIGVFFGTLIRSVAAAAILSVYVGNQLSALSVIAILFIQIINPILLTSLVGISLTLAFLIIAIINFQRKQF